jgi:hypothetical protein
MSQPLGHVIELHDSELAAVSQIGTSAVLSFAPAYVHESSGKPGVDAGFGWYQPATFTITRASIGSPVQMPVTIAEGSLRIGDTLHQNIVPAAGTFEGSIELSLVLSTEETLTVRGDTLHIELTGEPSVAEDFSP